MSAEVNWNWPANTSTIGLFVATSSCKNTSRALNVADSMEQENLANAVGECAHRLVLAIVSTRQQLLDLDRHKVGQQTWLVHTID